MTNDERREVSGWLFYNWKERKAKWIRWADAFGIPLNPDEAVYYVVVDLSQPVQFPPPVDGPIESRIVTLQYKTPAFATGRDLEKTLANLTGHIIRMIEHVLPEGTYGPGRPLSIRSAPDGATMRLPDGTRIHVHVYIERPIEGT